MNPERQSRVHNRHLHVIGALQNSVADGRERIEHHTQTAELHDVYGELTLSEEQRNQRVCHHTEADRRRNCDHHREADRKRDVPLDFFSPLCADRAT